jgi:hypothetical protein
MLIFYDGSQKEATEGCFRIFLAFVMKYTRETFRLVYLLVAKIRTGTSPFHVLLARGKGKGV